MPAPVAPDAPVAPVGPVVPLAPPGPNPVGESIITWCDALRWPPNPGEVLEPD